MWEMDVKAEASTRDDGKMLRPKRFAFGRHACPPNARPSQQMWRCPSRGALPDHSQHVLANKICRRSYPGAGREKRMSPLLTTWHDYRAHFPASRSIRAIWINNRRGSHCRSRNGFPSCRSWTSCFRYLEREGSLIRPTHGFATPRRSPFPPRFASEQKESVRTA